METLLPLLGFVVAGTVTPGPNNFMVLASGAN
jgi:threonine/homoserine/homoserine lactone efflux protein